MALENLYTKKLRTVLQSRYLFKIITIIFLIYALLITNIYNFNSKYNINTTKIIGTILKYNMDGNKLTIHLKAKEKLIITYYIDTKKEKEYYQNNLKLGSTLEVHGILKEPSNNTIPNIFNYRKYLYYNQIYYLMEAKSIVKINDNNNIFYFIKNKIKERIDKIDTTGYLSIFILGDKNNIDSSIMNNYQTNGVSHLFSISGMHISLLTSIILLVMKRLSYNNKINYLVVIFFLIFYLFLTNFTASILRATIMFILLGVNKCYNLKIKSIDIILIVLVIIIIINPFYIYNVGFQFSYIISFTLISLRNKIKKIKSKFNKNLYVSLVCFLVSFPISIYNFYQINLLSILLNIILIPLVSIIIYPLSLLTFIFPFLINIFNIGVSILEHINNLVSNITIFQLVLCKINIAIILIYYSIIYLSLYNKKYLVIFISIVLIHKNYMYFDNRLNVLTLDVGQGDSIFIKLPNNKGNILIDTGGIISYDNEDCRKKENKHSIVKSKTIPYLKSIGINKLDYLILTHGDYDHMGETINLVNNFKVDKVIFNCGEYNYLEKELIKVLDNKNIKYYNCIKELNIDDNKLYFLNNELYNNENDNSNVIYFNYNNHKFLFMGDAGIEKEKDILNKYNLKDIDFLKVGHHGSNTSSSKEFIDIVNPKYSLISVGKNNKYGHPKKSVIDILSNSKIYRTDLDGSVEIELNKNGYKIRTYSP